MHHRFSDFAEEDGPLAGKKKRIDDILNLEILVMDFKVSKSRYPEKSEHYTTIQFECENEKFVIFTGSKVLRDQLEKYKSELPFIAKIIKRDKYYTFS
jgi:hypothetical protein